MLQETVQTGRGGRLHARLWIGEDEESVGILVVIPGLGEHSGRYESLAQSLAPQGWSLFAIDLPGHGLSPGGRGRVDSFDGLLEDIAFARADVHERFADLPQVLMGSSMGGNLAINYTLRRHEMRPLDHELAGLILCAPMMLPPAPPPRPHIFAAWLTGHLLPWVCVNRPVDVQTLTSDPEQARAITDDPLMHSRITIYLATQLLSQGRWALDHARKTDVPTLVLYGQDDELIDRSACENLAIRIGSLAKLVHFPSKRHDLLHETGWDEVHASILHWLQQPELRSD